MRVADCSIRVFRSDVLTTAIFLSICLPVASLDTSVAHYKSMLCGNPLRPLQKCCGVKLVLSNKVAAGGYGVHWHSNGTQANVYHSLLHSMW